MSAEGQYDERVPDTKREAALLSYIAANVRRLRRKLGLTQEMLASAAGIDIRFLQKIEAANTNMSVIVLLNIADSLGEPIGALFRPASLPSAPRGRPRKTPAPSDTRPRGRGP